MSPKIWKSQTIGSGKLMNIQERKERLCEEQYQLYIWYIKGWINRCQYIALIKPIDIEIDALEMKIFYRYLQRHNIRNIDEIKNTKRDEKNTRTIKDT